MGNYKTRPQDHNDGDELTTSHQARERPRTVAAFFTFGILTYIPFMLVIVATQDILAATVIPTTTVCMANFLPYFLVSLIAPYFMQKIPYSARIALVYLLFTSGFIVVALVKQVQWKLIGVGIISFGSGVAEPTILSLTSFYGEVSLTAFSAGTGAGFLLAPLYYTAMTTWVCVSPNVAMLIIAAMLVVIFVCYHVINKTERRSPVSSTDNHDGIEYSVLKTNDGECNSSLKDDEENGGDGSLSWQEKFTVIRQMLPHIIPFYITFFCEYMIIQAVVTTLAFSHAPFKPREHYEYYILMFTGGEVMGRSHLMALSCIKEEWGEKAKFPYLWVVSLIEVTHLLFLVLAAWYRFLPSVWIVLLLLFTTGATVGASYVNAVTFFRDKFEERYKEFAMGYVIAASAGGVFTASILGLYTEPLLREHCMMLLSNTDFCFTRSQALNRFTSSCPVKHN